MADNLRINLQEAYQEACLALGEAIVRERLVMKHAYFPDEEAAKILEGADADANRDKQQGVENNGKVADKPPAT